MSHPILDTLHCAASCSRIELTPSRPAAALWLAWLAFAGLAVLFAVDLPWVARLGIGFFIVVPGALSIRRFVLLKGFRAVRVIEWTEDGEFAVRLGPTLTRFPASLDGGSFRLGLRFWVLRFVTPLGQCQVLLANDVRNAWAFRRLSLCLNRSLRAASGRGSRPAVTIQPNV
jgi:hypothetical protein